MASDCLTDDKFHQESLEMAARKYFKSVKLKKYMMSVLKSKRNKKLTRFIKQKTKQKTPNFLK